MQVLFTVVPLRVTSQFTLRAAPRWGRYSSIVVGIASNGAIQAGITAALAAPARGDRYIWRSSWRRVSGAWLLFVAHAALVRAVFALQHRVLARRASITGVAAEPQCV